MSAKIEKYLTYRNILILGILISVGITIQQLFFGSHHNLKVFYYAAQDIWSGINPYGEQWWRHGVDYFLYAPTFGVLFGIFTLFPMPLAGMLWNVGSAVALICSIYSLPNIDKTKKAYIFLTILLVTLPGVMTFQYNILVAAMFLWAFSLLEKGKSTWAIALIMLSACTKIYGGFELLLILLYPGFWKNVGWTTFWGVIFAIVVPFAFIGQFHYSDWLTALSSHTTSRPFEGFFDIKLLWGETQPAIRPFIQIGIFLTLSGLTIWRLKWRDNFNFKVGVLALIMGYVVLFSDSPEKHTYMIALAGFACWYFNKLRHNIFEKILFWAVFIIMGVVPVDLFCPKELMQILLEDWDLNNILFTIVWIYIFWDTFWKSGFRELKKIKN